MEPSVPNPCSVCKLPIHGSYVGTGDGSMKDGGSFAHPECYWRSQAEHYERKYQALRREMDRQNEEWFI